MKLSDLNAVSASESPFEFEYIMPNGKKSGVFFSVYGGQSERVTKEVNRLVNERRQKQALAEANRRMNNRTAQFEKLEDDVEFGQRLAAVRLAGWRGVDDQFTPEAALALCQSNRDIAAQITDQSDNIANFMKL
jgi:hypothetical protein